jgi:RNA polymerase sigma-70 factor (ECF subfamily)
MSTVTTTEQVWTQLHANIRGFVSRRVRQPADADDIVQRIFLQVHRALPTLRDTDRMHAWIYKMTRHAIADYYRAPAQRREVPAGAILETDSADTAVEPDAGEDVSALQELAACLHPLIAGLAPADREALQLVEFDGLSQAEASRRLGLSISGMKSRVQRARARLKTAVEDCCRLELDRRGEVRAFEPRGGSCGGCGCNG